jgi:hypothetical protein
MSDNLSKIERPHKSNEGKCSSVFNEPLSFQIDWTLVLIRPSMFDWGMMVTIVLMALVM